MLNIIFWHILNLSVLSAAMQLLGCPIGWQIDVPSCMAQVNHLQGGSDHRPVRLEAGAGSFVSKQLKRNKNGNSNWGMPDDAGVPQVSVSIWICGPWWKRLNRVPWCTMANHQIHQIWDDLGVFIYIYISYIYIYIHTYIYIYICVCVYIHLIKSSCLICIYLLHVSIFYSFDIQVESAFCFEPPMQVLLQLLPADATAGNTAVSATVPPRALLEAVAQDDAEDSEGAGGHGREWKRMEENGREWKRMEENGREKDVEIRRCNMIHDSWSNKYAKFVLAFSSGSGLEGIGLCTDGTAKLRKPQKIQKILEGFARG